MLKIWKKSKSKNIVFMINLFTTWAGALCVTLPTRILRMSKSIQYKFKYCSTFYLIWSTLKGNKRKCHCKIQFFWGERKWLQSIFSWFVGGESDDLEFTATNVFDNKTRLKCSVFKRRKKSLLSRWESVPAD